MELQLTKFILIGQLPVWYLEDNLITSKNAKFAQQVPLSFINCILHAYCDRSKITDVTGDLLPLGIIVISVCFSSEILGTCATFQIEITW